MDKFFLNHLKNKSDWVRRETLKIHGLAQETRIASSLSPVEIFTVLYYGKILRFRPKNINWSQRDRFITSKGHGSISLYPILADLGFFSKDELLKTGKSGSFLGAIPDPIIPGFETVNGSLGHGLGVGCGIALALKEQKMNPNVFVLLGDGELYEGSIWEAIMFAGAKKLDNLIAIIDNNKVCMLDYCKNVLDLGALDKKFKVFNWSVKVVDGHNLKQLYEALSSFKKEKSGRPKILVANTVKGKGVARLEADPLSHVKNLKQDEISVLLAQAKC